MTQSEKDSIFEKCYAFAISALIIALALLFYLNNRPW